MDSLDKEQVRLFLEDLGYMDGLVKKSNEEAKRVAAILRKYFVEGMLFLKKVEDWTGEKFIIKRAESVPPPGVTLIESHDAVSRVGGTVHSARIYRGDAHVIRIEEKTYHINEFMRLPAMKWRGHSYTAIEIVEFVANKLGGVHLPKSSGLKEKEKVLLDLYQNSIRKLANEKFHGQYRLVHEEEIIQGLILGLAQTILSCQSTKLIREKLESMCNSVIKGKS